MVKNDRALPVVLAAYPPPFAAGRKEFFLMSYSPNIPLPESLDRFFAPVCYIADSPPATDYVDFVAKPLEIALRTATTVQISARTGHPRPSTREFYQVVVRAPSPGHAEISRENVARALQREGILSADGHSPESNMRVILVDNPQSMVRLAEAVTSGNLSFAR